MEPIHINLTNGYKMGRKLIFDPIEGDRFNRWTVIRYAGKSESGKRLHECRCDCGKIAFVQSANLANGHSKSCGCLKSQLTKKRMTRHGKSRTATHITWNQMLQRCTNPNHISFPRYGARGISVCERWKVFESFLEDMGERPDGKTLDRIDHNGDYCPQNCRWSSAKDQGNNTRVNRRIEYQGVTRTMTEWADFANIPIDTFKRRIYLGWPIKKAVETPVKAR